MKLGICTSPENVALAAELGFDYVECALNALAAMNEDAFQALRSQAQSFPIPVSKCNCLLPNDLHPVGPDVSTEKLGAYLDRAFSRAAALGVKLVVFGSGGARNVPEGWTHEDAWSQLESFLRFAAGYGDKYDMDIAIEPLRPAECNILQLVSEGSALAARVNHPRVGVLGDTFHMRSSKEPYQHLSDAGRKLMHIHISHTLPDLSGRIYPRSGDGEDYHEIIGILKRMDYPGDISIEAGAKDIRADGEAAITLLRPLIH